MRSLILLAFMVRAQLVSAVHSASQTRTLQLIQAPGFFLTSADAHNQMGMTTDTFVEIGKLAMRANLGVLVTLEPVKWKGCAWSHEATGPGGRPRVPATPRTPQNRTPRLVRNPRGRAPYQAGSDIVKTGGHQITAFVKTTLPNAAQGGEHLKVMKALSVLNMKAATYKNVLYHPIADGNRSSANMRRLEAPAKILLAAAFAAKRADLLTADTVAPAGEDPDAWSFKEIAQEVEADSGKVAFWQNQAKVACLHRHILRLVHAALQAQDVTKGTNVAATLEFNLPELPEPHPGEPES